MQLIGADASLRTLGGALVKHTELEPFAGIGAVLLPSSLARQIGVTKFGREVTLALYGRRSQAPLYEQLGPGKIGALSASPIVIAPLAYAQEAAGLPGRVSRILVAPRPGQGAAVRRALLALAAGRLNVAPTSYDEELFAKAASASNQSTALFAVISALVGFLFAFNAMLLTVAQRRRLIAELRRDGYTPGDVTRVLTLDAVLLGIAATAVGLLLGQELSVHLFRENPGYLGSAFALGSQRVVGWQAFALAIAGGMLAALVAVLSPLRDIRSRDPLAAISVRERSRSARANRAAVAGGLLCVLIATAILLTAPKLAIGGMLALIAGLLLLLGVALDGAVGLLGRLARRVTGAVGHVAAMELAAARSRAVGVAATGAVAVFGAVAIQGAHADLLKGLQNAARDENAYTDIWVVPPGGYDLLRTAPFPGTLSARLQKLAGVKEARVYRGALLDWGTRRVWVIAPPPAADPLLPGSQILEGNITKARREVLSGAVVLSGALAAELHAHIGSTIRLPSPVPETVRVAAISTNIGWAPGAMIMGAGYFARRWGSGAASAYNVLVDPGTPVARAAGEIRAALGPGSGLSVQTAAAHEAEQNALSRQGLDRLTQIATLILAVAVLAMAAAIGSMLAQRRPRLAKLKLEGFARAELWRTTLLESALLVGTGCLAGALFGLYGEQLLDRALANVINFPVVHSLALIPAILSVLVVALAALAIVAIPGYIASGVSPAVALED